MNDHSKPSVTCLCLTRNRRGWLKRAISCFERQSYENSKLLIVADGEDISDVVPDDPRISLVSFSEETRPRTIGAKRNVGCAMVDTDLIVNWDDDEESLSTRLTDQVERMVDSGCSVSGYNRIIFRDGPEWWVYEGYPGFAAGTSLIFRRDWWEKHPFPDMHIGEDSAFAEHAFKNGTLVTSDAGFHMYANIWAGNTSKKSTIGPTWKKLTPQDVPAEWL